MKQLLISLCAASLVLASCGTGKKLQAANAQIASLDSQVATLNSQNAALSSKLSDCDKQSSQLKTENVQYAKEAEDCRKAKEAIAQKMDNLNRNLAEHGTSMEKIRQKISDALAQFHDAGAEVTYKNGLVYISMQDKLAFASGSTKLNDNGRQVLSVVADALNEFPKITAIVVGNADSMAIRKAYKDNWSLSTERANTVVRVLRDTYSIDPARLTAAGKSKYAPLGDNATPEGRAKNRRTDIILNPDISRLWEMMENKQ